MFPLFFLRTPPPLGLPAGPEALLADYKALPVPEGSEVIQDVSETLPDRFKILPAGSETYITL